MSEKPPFDPDAEYEVAQDFVITGPTHFRGDAFDKSLVNTRLLRRLYNIGLIRLRPRAVRAPELGAPHRDHGPVTFVPTARKARSR